MPTAAVALAHGPYRLRVAPQEVIQQRGLPYSRGTQQHDCLPGCEKCVQRFQAVSGARTHRKNRDTGGDAFYFCDASRDIIAVVCLVENDDGARARFPALRQKPFEAP